MVSVPNPAVVTQAGAVRLPRVLVLLLCLVYVLAGFVGRSAWRNADLAAYGFMQELARGLSSWQAPTLMGQAAEGGAVLPYWLGAVAIWLAPSWLSPELAARLPFALLLAVTLAATWYSAYYLARARSAHPITFAFGGQAEPVDYARALADAALLALISCLGLAQLGHEATTALVQLAATSACLYALAAWPHRPVASALALCLGAVALALSAAPLSALGLAGLFGLSLAWQPARATQTESSPSQPPAASRRVALAVALVALVLASALSVWSGALAAITIEHALALQWWSLLRLLLWFTWPAWPLALWALWVWRRQPRSTHVALPLMVLALLALNLLVQSAPERALLSALPPLAVLAAFALPTLKRSVSALIDWFTLLFFTGCALFLWLMWFAKQTGAPAKLAANIAKLAPGFEPKVSWLAFFLALAATLAWAFVVRWRTARHRAALWKSLALPAAGAALCWVLLMTLWLPLLDYIRGYQPWLSAIQRQTAGASCLQVHGLAPHQIAALKFQANQVLRVSREAVCPWLLVSEQGEATLAQAVKMENWQAPRNIRRLRESSENFRLYARAPG